MTYYVYGIIDPTELPDDDVLTLASQLASVIYVGKGTGLRSEDHAEEARELLEREMEGPGVRPEYSRKLNRLINLFRGGNPPQTIKLAAGFSNEDDAYKVETLAIETISALRLACGREPLTNAVKGHGIAVEPLAQHEARLHTEKFEVTDRDGTGQLAILVKANLSEMGNGEFKPGDPSNLPLRIRKHTGRIDAMERIGDRPPRRGWDLHLPWTDEEARERGRRYWALGVDNVLGWLDDPTTAPSHLLLAVKEGRGVTIRYAWRIDPDGTWEFHDGSRWGIPLGDAEPDHPLLNAIPVRDDGRSAMLGNSGGHKLIRYHDESPGSRRNGLQE